MATVFKRALTLLLCLSFFSPSLPPATARAQALAPVGQAEPAPDSGVKVFLPLTLGGRGPAYSAAPGGGDGNSPTVYLPRIEAYNNEASNRPPAARDDSATIPEDSTLNLDAPGLLGNDSDPNGDALTVRLAAEPAHGTLALHADGSFTYTPAKDYFGPDSFTYVADDGAYDSDKATVTLTITPINDAPSAIADTFATGEDTVLTIPAPGVLANDQDVENDRLTGILLSGPAHGSLVLNVDGSFTYTPDSNYLGPDSFTYAASDGQLDSGPATVGITVLLAADQPVAVGDTYSTDEDAALRVPAPGILANDTDAENEPLSSILVAGPAHGTLTLRANGSFVFTPTQNFFGTDNFTYAANDGQLSSAAASVGIAVQPVNDAPSARNDGYAVDEGTVLAVSAPGILANDIDVENSPLSSVLISGPAYGALALKADGSFSYTPTAAFSGTLSFVYKANDGSLDSAPATVSLTVAIPNLPPDPATVAPPVDPSTATNLADATAFLYTGHNPIQTGVVSGTISPERVAVVRGKVLDVTGNPLPGVTVAAKDHPELGQTLSRADGMFDFAVNGGGLLTIEYVRSGFLPAQRKISTPWQDYVWVDDVILVQQDSKVTNVDLTSSEPIQVAQGSVISDTRGSRQATLLVPHDTAAEIVLGNGMTETLSNMHVRVTEYTVGANGPDAMPADLPPNVAYTYAIEYSVRRSSRTGL